MDKIIKQLDESEVIQAIVDDKRVIRVNLDDMKACNLASKSIATIRNDFNCTKYVYFVVEEAGDND